MKEYTFADSSYANKNFKKLELESLKIADIEFENCTFTNCKMPKAKIKDCVFNSCNFRFCDLSFSDLTNTRLLSCTFEECDLVAINWSLLDWPIYFSLEFNKCVLNRSSFVGLNLKGIKILSSFCNEVDFSESDLQKAVLTKTEFLNSIFRNNNLEKANFKGDKYYSINPIANSLKGAQFDLPEAVSLLENMGIKISE